MTIEELFAYMQELHLRDDILLEMRTAICGDGMIRITMFCDEYNLSRVFDLNAYPITAFKPFLDTMKEDIIKERKRGE